MSPGTQVQAACCDIFLNMAFERFVASHQVRSSLAGSRFGIAAKPWRLSLLDIWSLRWTTIWSMLLWWLVGAIVALALGLALWCAGAFIYLKVRYRAMTDRQHSPFMDLDKEQRTPRSGSL
jgi:hypothetical protein